MEKHGHHYHFISEREFLSMRDRGEFLEWAEVHGNMYGTSRAEVERYLAQDRDVILEIDVQGASQVKEKIPDARLIFIEPPSLEVLERRLRMRRTEQEDALTRRLADAYDELRKKGLFDGVVVNIEIDAAVEEVLLLMDRLKEKDR